MTWSRGRRRRRQSVILAGLPLVSSVMLLAAPGVAQSQQVDTPVITIAQGASELLQLSEELSRVAVADSSIANPVLVSPSEILINGRGIGSTTLIVWNENDRARAYTVDVTFDVAALNRVFATVFPGEAIEATAHANMVILTGTVSGAAVASRMVEIARGTGATVIEHFTCIRPSISC